MVSFDINVSPIYQPLVEVAIISKFHVLFMETFKLQILDNLPGYAG